MSLARLSKIFVLSVGMSTVALASDLPKQMRKIARFPGGKSVQDVYCCCEAILSNGETFKQYMFKVELNPLNTYLLNKEHPCRIDDFVQQYCQGTKIHCSSFDEKTIDLQHGFYIKFDLLGSSGDQSHLTRFNELNRLLKRSTFVVLVPHVDSPAKRYVQKETSEYLQEQLNSITKDEFWNRFPSAQKIEVSDSLFVTNANYLNGDNVLSPYWYDLPDWVVVDDQAIPFLQWSQQHGVDVVSDTRCSQLRFTLFGESNRHMEQFMEGLKQVQCFQSKAQPRVDNVELERLRGLYSSEAVLLNINKRQDGVYEVVTKNSPTCIIVSEVNKSQPYAEFFTDRGCAVVPEAEGFTVTHQDPKLLERAVIEAYNKELFLPQPSISEPEPQQAENRRLPGTEPDPQWMKLRGDVRRPPVSCEVRPSPRDSSLFEVVVMSTHPVEIEHLYLNYGPSFGEAIRHSGWHVERTDEQQHQHIMRRIFHLRARDPEEARRMALTNYRVTANVSPQDDSVVTVVVDSAYPCDPTTVVLRLWGDVQPLEQLVRHRGWNLNQRQAPFPGRSIFEIRTNHSGDARSLAQDNAFTGVYVSPHDESEVIITVHSERLPSTHEVFIRNAEGNAEPLGSRVVREETVPVTQTVLEIRTGEPEMTVQTLIDEGGPSLYEGEDEH